MKRSRSYLALVDQFQGQHSPADAARILAGLGRTGAVTATFKSGPRTTLVFDLPFGRGRMPRVGVLANQSVPSSLVDASSLTTDELLGLDVLCAHPSRLAGLPLKRLASAGLQPSVNTGTLGADPLALAAAYLAGRVVGRADAAGNLAVPVGSLSMGAADLEANLRAVLTGPATLTGHSLPPLRVA